jgi:transcriptional regulator of acetoin/glycerol metabolism
MGVEVWLCVVGPDGAETVALPPQAQASLWEGMLTLTALSDGRVQVRPGEGEEVRLNEVQLKGASIARVGDFLECGELAVLIQGHSPLSLGRSLWSYDALSQRLEEALAVEAGQLSLWSVRAATDAIQLAAAMADVLAVPGARLVAGELAPGRVLAVLPEGQSPRAGRLEAHLGVAPVHEEVWTEWRQEATAFMVLDRALNGALEDDDDEPLRVDPVMQRLHTTLERIAKPKGLVVLRGEPSVGKGRLAKSFHALGGLTGELVQFEAGTFSHERWEAAVERARGGTLYVQSITGLPPAIEAALGSLKTRVVAAAPLGYPVENAKSDLLVPALRDRPSEVLPFAEHFLRGAAKRLGRPKLAFSALTRELLVEDPWPGNLSELRAAVTRAALVSKGNELRPEHLPSRFAERARNVAGQAGLRATLKAAERTTLLETLGKTSWNVTATAKALGLPRRTVVYRMSRLGLRRPERG